MTHNIQKIVYAMESYHNMEIRLPESTVKDMEAFYVLAKDAKENEESTMYAIARGIIDDRHWHDYLFAAFCNHKILKP